MSQKQNIPTMAKNRFFVLTGVTILVLCLDVLIIKLPNYTISNRTSDFILGIFAIITISSIIIQFLYLRISLATNKINFVFFNLSTRIIKFIAVIIQSIIICMLLLVLLQIIISESYFTSLIKYTIIVSASISIFFISLLFIRFLSWYHSSRSKFLLLFAFSTIGIIANSILVILFSYYTLLNVFQVMDPLIPSINNMVIHQPVLKNAYLITSTIEFALMWVSSILILRPFASNIGVIRFWFLMAIPSIYFVSKFHFYQFWLSDLLMGTALLTPVSFLRFLTLLDVATSVIGAIVFGIAFWLVSRKILDNSLRQFIQISGIGISLLFLSSQVTNLTLLPYPPFGLVSISFASISSYLLFIGLYHAAMITSRNSVIRSLIHKSANDELRFIGTMGTSEMKQNITSQFKQVIKKFGSDISDINYESTESDHDVKKFVAMALSERQKYLNNVATPRQYLREESPFEQTWETWVERWWQWCYSFPDASSPVTDSSGQFCKEHQDYKSVWFLAGTFGGKAERNCTLPRETSIFFPILTDIVSFYTDPRLKTKSELDAYSKADLDHTQLISVKMDGHIMLNLYSYRVHTNLFSIDVPDINNKVLRVKTQAISDGYWMFLKPLSLGKHRLEFIGEKLEFDRIDDYKNISDNDIKNLAKFRVEVTYYIEIV